MASIVRRIVVPLVAAAGLLAGCEAEKPEQSDARTKAGTATRPKDQTATPEIPAGTGFDFYVLSLSWSPTWCAGNDAAGRTGQCAADASHGFIVHGLWPQNETGFPEYCRTGEPDRVPERIGKTLLDIMPSMGLIGHQWRKHGSCSGLNQRDYFSVVRAAWQKLRIPPALQLVDRQRQAVTGDIETAFIVANPELGKNAIAITCEAKFLEDVRVCYNKDLSFRACPQVDARGCRQKSVTLPPIP